MLESLVTANFRATLACFRLQYVFCSPGLRESLELISKETGNSNYELLLLPDHI